MMSDPNPVLVVNNLRDKYGEEWLLRFVQGIVQFRRENIRLAEDFGISAIHVNRIRRICFDRVKIKDEMFYFLRPTAREQIVAWEEYRRKRFEEVLSIENRVLATACDPERLKLYSDKIALEYAPGVSRALNELRERMGEKSFKSFLHKLRSSDTIFEIADRFRRFGVRSDQLALWRKMVTKPTRALVPELAKLMKAPLELVMPKEKKEPVERRAVRIPKTTRLQRVSAAL